MSHNWILLFVINNLEALEGGRAHLKSTRRSNFFWKDRKCLQVQEQLTRVKVRLPGHISDVGDDP